MWNVVMNMTFLLIQSIFLAHFTYIWGRVFLLNVFPWSLELGLRLVCLWLDPKVQFQGKGNVVSLGRFQCCSRNADCGVICLWPWKWPSQSALIFDFSKSWGSFYVKGVLSSFVIFGGLVSNFFDIAYPGVHGCVSCD